MPTNRIDVMSPAMVVAWLAFFLTENPAAFAIAGLAAYAAITGFWIIVAVLAARTPAPQRTAYASVAAE